MKQRIVVRAEIFLEGDHLILTKAGAKRPLVIKTSPGEVPVTHILTNLRTSGMSRERYSELLRQV